MKRGIRILVEKPEKVILREQVWELRERGMSYPAIARMLNVSEGTAWNMVHRKP
ncbi:MAG: helix-turn-helix domain-containing protein [Anaerolineae bacterium]|nr:helix-turn-helix domain-containing protein [Anaerolineae bacterium]